MAKYFNGPRVIHRTPEEKAKEFQWLLDNMTEEQFKAYLGL